MEVITTIIGGICFFLFGMRLSKEGLQQSSGDRLRNYVTRITQSRWHALFLGIVVTFVLQSSTASTAMLISFVNVGLIHEVTGLAVSLGSGIGTALFVFVLSKVLHLPIEGYAILLMAVGLFAMQVGKRRGSNVGRILLGFGFLLYGVKLIAIAGTQVQHSTYVLEQLQNMSDRPVTTIIVSIILTIILQSSTATIGILLSLAVATPMPLTTAIPIVLGANIGTISTMLMASLQGNEQGRRIALGYLFVKLLGVILVVPFLQPICHLLTNSFSTVTEQIAFSHLAFNILSGILFAPFLSLVVKLLNRLVPKELFGEEKFQVKYLDKQALDTPSLALGNAVREIIRMADIIQDMFILFMEILDSNREDLVDKLEDIDDQLDTLNREIKFYLAKITQSSLTEPQSKEQLELLSLTTAFEEIGDIINRNLGALARKKIRNHLTFSEEGWRDIKNLHTMVLENIHLSITAYSTHNVEIAKKVLRHKEKITKIFEELQQGHLNRLQEGLKESFATSSLHMELLSNMLRINILISKLVKPVIAQQEISSR